MTSVITQEVDNAIKALLPDIPALARTCASADPRTLYQRVTNEGLCREIDTDLFFPDYADHAAFRNAARVCQACGVRTDCLVLALRNGEEHGCWGGLAPQPRSRLLRALRDFHDKKL